MSMPTGVKERPKPLTRQKYVDDEEEERQWRSQGRWVDKRLLRPRHAAAFAAVTHCCGFVVQQQKRLVGAPHIPYHTRLFPSAEF